VGNWVTESIHTISNGFKFFGRYVYDRVDEIFGLSAVSAMSLSLENPNDVEFLTSAEEGPFLPNPLKKKFSWVECVRAVRARLKKGARLNPSEVDELLASKGWRAGSVVAKGEDGVEQIWSRIYPPRTKKDMRIRRTRIADVFTYAYKTGKRNLFHKILRELPAEGDYIWMMNTVLAGLLFGEEWWRRMMEIGAWNGDISEYLKVVKALNDFVKTKEVTFEWLQFAELGTLVGYRNPPFPGFDVFEEARALAEGGNEFFLPFTNFKDAVKIALKMDYQAIKYISFRDFITSGQWLTSGSSSIGKVTLIYKDKILKVKARKNMVPFVVDLEALANDAEKWDQQVNTTLIKSELGKLRIAVAGDILTYLQMSWMNYLLNNSYLSWPGSTLDETIGEQTKRMLRMLELAAKKFGLPFDYKGFDHQPTLQQVLDIVEHLLHHARLNVPPDEYSNFNKICDNILKGFRGAVLIARENERKEIYQVTGGVMSGLRWTSLLGNGWNTVMTWLAKEVLVKLGFDITDIESYIRGDDSAIFSDSWQKAAMMDRAYSFLGVEGGEGKFSVRYHAMEFLRVWYKGKCSGYPARAIPGLTQRKPWSNQPWSDDMVMRALFDVAKTITRRGVDAMDFYSIVASRWCHLHHLPRESLQIPKTMGGFGVEPWSGDLVMKPHLDEFKPERPEFTNMTEWRATWWKERGKELEIEVDSELAKENAEQDLMSTMGADDVPQISKVLREQWKDYVRRTKFTTSKVTQPVTQLVTNEDNTLLKEHTSVENQLEQWNMELEIAAPMFGRWTNKQQDVQDAKRLLPKGGLGDWIRSNEPELWHDMRKFDRSWDRGERLDYLFGKITIATREANPLVSQLIAKATAAILRPHRSFLHNDLSWYATIMEGRLEATKWYRTLWLW